MMWNAEYGVRIREGNEKFQVPSSKIGNVEGLKCLERA